MTESAIEFRKICKSYGDFHVVRDIDLKVGPSEFLALLGPSGCGKSTILKMIAGIEDPTSGEIYVDGELVNYKMPRERHVAMVFQNYALYPHMTVAQNIAYPLTTPQKPRPSKAEQKERMERAADIVNISDQLEKKPSALSGGQRQRVALARAIIREPSVFLMDEPLSNLDALLRDTMRHQLIDLHRRVGKATVYVTHDQLEAMTMADRIVVLNNGIIQQIGSPQDIFSKPANLFVAGFVGNPRMNLIEGVSLDDGLVRIGNTTLKSNSRTTMQAKVTVGLRPTDSIAPGAGNDISAIVQSVEFTGADNLVNLRCDDSFDLNLRRPNTEKIAVGDRLKFGFEPEDIHVFSSEGKRL